MGRRQQFVDSKNRIQAVFCLRHWHFGGWWKRILTIGGPSFLQQVLTRVQQQCTSSNTLLFGLASYTLGKNQSYPGYFL